MLSSLVEYKILILIRHATNYKLKNFFFFNVGLRYINIIKLSIQLNMKLVPWT